MDSSVLRVDTIKKLDDSKHDLKSAGFEVSGIPIQTVFKSLTEKKTVNTTAFVALPDSEVKFTPKAADSILLIEYSVHLFLAKEDAGDWHTSWDSPAVNGTRIRPKPAAASATGIDSNNRYGVAYLIKGSAGYFMGYSTVACKYQCTSTDELTINIHASVGHLSANSIEYNNYGTGYLKITEVAQ